MTLVRTWRIWGSDFTHRWYKDRGVTDNFRIRLLASAELSGTPSPLTDGLCQKQSKKAFLTPKNIVRDWGFWSPPWWGRPGREKEDIVNIIECVRVSQWEGNGQKRSVNIKHGGLFGHWLSEVAMWGVVGQLEGLMVAPQASWSFGRGQLRGGCWVCEGGGWGWTRPVTWLPPISDHLNNMWKRLGILDPNYIQGWGVNRFEPFPSHMIDTNTTY